MIRSMLRTSSASALCLKLPSSRCPVSECWYRDVLHADKAAEVAWLRANVMGADQALWALRITARDRYSDRCWGWGESLDIALEGAADRSGTRWSNETGSDRVP